MSSKYKHKICLILLDILLLFAIINSYMKYSVLVLLFLKYSLISSCSSSSFDKTSIVSFLYKDSLLDILLS